MSKYYMVFTNATSTAETRRSKMTTFPNCYRHLVPCILPPSVRPSQLASPGHSIPPTVVESHTESTPLPSEVIREKSTGTYTGWEDNMNEDENGLVARPIDGMMEEIKELAIRLTDQLVRCRGCCRACQKQSQDEHAGEHATHTGLAEFLHRRDVANYPDVLGSEGMTSGETNLASQADGAAKRRLYFTGSKMTALLQHRLMSCPGAENRPTQRCRGHL